MNEKVLNPTEIEAGALETDEDAGAALDNAAAGDDTSIRTLLQRAMQSDADAPPAAASSASDRSENEADAPIVDDQEPTPPTAWSEAERELWRELPKAAQDAIHRRERDFQAGLKSDAELQKVVMPLAERLKGSDLHVDQYVKQLLTADQYISERPLEATLALIQRHGLADQIMQQIQQAPAREQHRNAPGDDTQQRIADLERKLDYQRQVDVATQEWTNFKAQHPDAEQLREVIASKIGIDPRLSYAQAYEQARELVTSYSGSVAKAKEAASIEAKSKAAAKGSRLNLPRGRSDTPPSPTSSGSLRDDIAAAMRTTGFRAN